jgi:hypothetical protein
MVLCYIGISPCISFPDLFGFVCFLIKVTVKFIKRGIEGEKREKYFLFPMQEMGAKTPPFLLQ